MIINNTYILADQDGNGSWDSPFALRLNHNDNQGFIFDHLVHTKENFPIESGTFTPQLRTTTDATEPSYQSSLGAYSRIGSLCFIGIYIVLSSVLTTSGSLQIHNLPFNSQSNNSQIWSPTVVMDWNAWNLSDNYWLKASVSQGTNYIRIWQQSFNGQLQQLTTSRLNSNSMIRLGGTYAV